MLESRPIRIGASLAVTLGLAIACGNPDDGTGGSRGGAGGKGGSTTATGGSSGAATGSGGSTTGTGGSGATTGSGGSAGVGTGGASGKGGAAGTNGSAGAGASGGSGGASGTAGRAGASGSAGKAGGAGSGGSAGTAGAGGADGGTCVKGTVQASQVVWIGDSYPAAGSGGIQKYTETSAQTAGSLAQGATYRKYYVSGTQMGNGQIPGQYTTAKQADPKIDTVIMTGGGNDVLIGNSSCLTSPPPTNTSCVDTVNTAAAAAETLLTQMQTDGVKYVVYYFYPRITAGQGAANVDYAFPVVKARCDKFTGALKCFFVDTRPPFEGKNWFSDGIHPTAEGQKAIADLVWATMTANCIAQ